MALAATGSESLTEQVYAASGKELNLLGVNWTYAPVADINIDKRNPVIGVRSFGDGTCSRSTNLTLKFNFFLAQTPIELPDLFQQQHAGSPGRA